jgi:hypothetical protein
MAGAPKALIIISAISLIVAIIGVCIGDIVDIPPEGYSRASANTALLAIGWHMIMGGSDR